MQARSSPLNCCDKVYTQSQKLYEDILTSLDRGNVGWKMVYNFLGKDEKHGEISTYFRFKHYCGKEVRHFFPCSVSKQRSRDCPLVDTL